MGKSLIDSNNFGAARVRRAEKKRRAPGETNVVQAGKPAERNAKHEKIPIVWGVARRHSVL